MLNLLKQARAAFSMLSADEVRKQADKPIHVGLVSDNVGAYGEMENFFLPESLTREERSLRMTQIHRAHDPAPPDSVDIVVYEPGMACPANAFTYHRDAPERTVAEILEAHRDVALALARQYPVFRQTVVERTIHEVARENALFALTTALPNIVPNLIELPWVVGEFASDTAFITANQVRLAFRIAAAYGQEVGMAEQKFQLLGIAGGAIGWRALARELVSHIPFGGGLIPKAAIAYAGTYAAGKGLEVLYVQNAAPGRDEQKSLYERGLARGREIARELRPAV